MHPTSDGRIFSGNWPRFDRYEVKDGSIRPVEGSPLRSYEPWSTYKPPRGKETRRQPYHSLLDLVRNIDSGELDQGARDLAIAEWCGRHGPLGVWLPEHCLGEEGALRRRNHPEFEMEVPPIWAGLWLFQQKGSATLIEPNDLTERFALYSERVETFLIAGRLLRRLVDQLQATRESKKGPKDKQIEFQKQTERLIGVLSRAQPVMFERSRPRGGRWRVSAG
jgi:hypothetical protein